MPCSEKDPTPVLVYGVVSGQSICKADLVGFRSTRLDGDDVFQPEFLGHIVFYGAEEDDLHIEADAQDELLSWGVRTQTFLTAHAAVEVPSGPYVIFEGKTWQPWKIYHDFNACFVTAFKPSRNPEAR